MTLLQNESNLNAAYGPVIRTVIHKILSSDAMKLIHVELWGNVTNALRVDVDVNTFSDAGRERRTRAILETERRFSVRGGRNWHN